MKNVYVIVFAISVLVIRMVTQMIWQQMDNADIYFIGQSIMELGLTIVVAYCVQPLWAKAVLQFFTGLAIYGLFKFLFMDGYSLDYDEYIAALVGFLFTIGQILYLRK